MSYSACLQGAFSLGKQDCSPARGMVGTVEAAWHSGENCPEATPQSYARSAHQLIE